MIIRKNFENQLQLLFRPKINSFMSTNAKTILWDSPFHLHYVSQVPKMFKGTVSGDGYYFEGLNILISTFCVCVDGFKRFSLPYTIINFLFASLNSLTHFENAYWNPPQIPFSVIGQWSLELTSHCLQGKFARINLSQTTYITILQNYMRLL